MGGELTVTSEAGVGSTFTVTIPANHMASLELITPEEIREHAEKRAKAAASQKLTRLPNKPILVVDDGDANR